jgi:hypothetical protein
MQVHREHELAWRERLISRRRGNWTRKSAQLWTVRAVVQCALGPCRVDLDRKRLARLLRHRRDPFFGCSRGMAHRLPRHGSLLSRVTGERRSLQGPHHHAKPQQTSLCIHASTRGKVTGCTRAVAEW